MAYQVVIELGSGALAAARAEAARDAAEAAQTGSETAQAAAAGSATAAAGSASTASTQAGIATAQAGISTTQASASAASAEAAEAFAEVAQVYANQPYPDRAAALAASKVPGQRKFEVIAPDGSTLRYVEDADATTPALTMADGTKLMPDGKWSYEHFGATGSGDEGAIIAALHAAIDGQTIECPPDKTYSFNPQTHAQVWATPFIMRANGSKFRCLAASSSGYAITITADTRGDDLVLETVGASNAQFNERGIDMPVGGMWDRVAVIGDNDRSGANNSAYQAVRIGPASGSRVAAWIGKIEATNWDRPVALRLLTDSVIGRVNIENYRRGLYILDVQDTYINGGHIKGITATSLGRAGENGVLIEASADHETKNLFLNGLVAEDAGEHGFRIGGQSIVSGVWHNYCRSINAGSGDGPDQEPPGDDDHGGCGFKVLGPTSQQNKYHQDIHYIGCSVHQVNLDRFPDRVNYAGFQLGKVWGVSVVNPTVLPSMPGDTTTEAAYSCYNGVELIGCRDVNISNPNIRKPYRSGVLLYDAEDTGGVYWGQMESIRITGGGTYLSATSTAAIEARANYKTMRRVTIDGFEMSGPGNALLATKSGSGAYTGCTLGGTAWTTTSDTLSGNAASDWLVNLTGQMIGTRLVNPARNGSTFHDFNDGGKLLERRAAGWVEPNGTLVVTLQDDTATSFAVEWTDGHILVSCSGTAYYGHIWARPTSSPASVKVSGGANMERVNTTLSGTTGTDGNLTIGVQNGVLYVENRTGGSQTIRVTQLST